MAKTKDTFTRAEILEALTLEPCHVTGMHDPRHTPKYICALQLCKALRQLFELLGVTEEELPRRLSESYWDAPERDGYELLVAWRDKVPLRYGTEAGTIEEGSWAEAWEAGWAKYRETREKARLGVWFNGEFVFLDMAG